MTTSLAVLELILLSHGYCAPFLPPPDNLQTALPTTLEIPVSEAGLHTLCQQAHATCGIIIDLSMPPQSKQIMHGVKTLYDYLDWFVALAPRYKWSRHGRTIRIEPKTMPPAVTKALYRTPIRSRRLKGDALRAAIDLLAEVGIFTSSANFSPAKYPSIDFALSTRDAESALDEISNSPGSSAWILRYRQKGAATYYQFALLEWPVDSGISPTHPGKN